MGRENKGRVERDEIGMVGSCQTTVRWGGEGLCQIRSLKSILRMAGRREVLQVGSNTITFVF